MLYLSLADFDGPSQKKSNIKKRSKKSKDFFPLLHSDSLPKVLPSLFMAICSSI